MRTCLHKRKVLFFNNLFGGSDLVNLCSLKGYTTSVILLSLFCDRRVEIYIIVIAGHFLPLFVGKEAGRKNAHFIV